MDMLEIMREVILFHGLDEADLRQLAAIATRETYPPGRQVFAEGAVGDSLFIVKYGTVAVVKSGRGGDEEVARMSAGQHVGEMALVDDDTRSATVQAVEHTELVRMRRQDLEQLLARDEALGHRVYRVLARYLCRRLRQTTADLTFMREVAKRPRG